MRILFCQLRNHGDIIRTFPLIDAIKSIHPDWYIGFTCFMEMVNTCKLSSNIDVMLPQPRFLPVTDTQGGTRKVVETDTKKEIVYDEKSGTKTIITQSIVSPKIEGAIITAEGGNNTNTKANIIQAVEAVTGLPTHKIQVFEMEKTN